jgi:hypothetical protein
MESGGRRSQEERAAAREARERGRIDREQGLDAPEDAEPQESGGSSQRPDLGSMRTYGGGPDLYARRRMIAIGVVVVILLLLFLLLGGC